MLTTVEAIQARMNELGSEMAFALLLRSPNDHATEWEQLLPQLVAAKLEADAPVSQ